ncbi:unnamed protein product [Adineta steineri]|uniref:Uncharacterized protein n=1 Tax=Adineta steineri TaxID=433720 RepID=A0A815U347_9BILA|nr:unnamed protein product [Adineta steineri]CAF1510866.1 unnamed protein product [Adineta steineri]
MVCIKNVQFMLLISCIMILFVNSSPTSMGNSNEYCEEQSCDGICKVDYACYTFCKGQTIIDTQNLPYPLNSTLISKLINKTGLCHGFCKFGTCYCFLTSDEITTLLSNTGADGVDPTDTVVSTGTKINGKNISPTTIICGNPTMSN